MRSSVRPEPTKPPRSTLQRGVEVGRRTHDLAGQLPPAGTGLTAVSQADATLLMAVLRINAAG